MANRWDPSKAGAHVSFADSFATAIIAGDQDTVFARYGRDVARGGKYAFEVYLAAEDLNSPVIGVGTIGQDYGETLGWAGFGWSYVASASPIKVHSGSGGSYGVSMITVEGWVMCCLNFDAGEISFLTSHAAPGAGSDQGVMYSGLAGTVYPAVNAGNTGPETTHFTLNCEGPFHITLPVGYLPFGGSPRNSLLNIIPRL